MKRSLFFTLLTCCASLLILGGCKKNSQDVWDDSSTMGSYKRARERVLWGAADAELVSNTLKPSSFADDDFIPLQDEDLKGQFADATFLQPKESPGEMGSSIPGIGGFEIPKGALSSVFRPVHFNTDDYSVKSPETSAILSKVASYLKEHPKTFIFVEGHCDRRGPEAYNQSLGAKRANAVRTELIQFGASPEQIYTISYGKERPENTADNPEAWAQNRRAQFKLYTQH